METYLNKNNIETKIFAETLEDEAAMVNKWTEMNITCLNVKYK